MTSPNFLHNFVVSLQKPMSCGSVFGLFLFLFLLFCISFISPLWSLALFLVSLVFLFTLHTEWGIYLLAAVAFFHGWQIDLATMEWTKEIAFLSLINAPVVDFVALGVFVSVLLACIVRRQTIRGNTVSDMLPGILPYGLFFLVAALSFFSSTVSPLEGSVSLLLRPIVFVYVLFLLVPYHVIRTKKTLEHVVSIWFMLGMLIALYGLSSLFIVDGNGWNRVTPYPLGGFTPLGNNHNLLAEILVTVVPLGAWLFFKTKKPLYGFGTALIALTALLTLSRGAWIALTIQAGVVLWLKRKTIRESFLRVHPGYTLGGLAFFLAASGYMLYFLLAAPVVTSSTFSRVEATRVAFSLFQDQPFIGYGPGTFVPLMKEVAIFTAEFGEPLDAHGFIQKILVEEGLLGLVFFLWFLIAILRRLYSGVKTEPSMLAFFLMVLGGMVVQLFSTTYFSSIFWMPMGVALAAREIKNV